MSSGNLNKVTAAGILVTLGIIYGDIGTSPLYVMNALVGDSIITRDLVLGGISCIFWTLTLQTTIKYILLTLQADNNGEGGIFSLYSLLRRRFKDLIIFAIIGGAMLLADGIITPPISVSSAIEGLLIVYPDLPTVPIVIGVIILIFFFQRLGTTIVGKAFGPIMLLWFLMLASLGLSQIIQNPEVLAALSPHYAIKLLVNSEHGFLILGAVFLCTTGAEALYSDLGHCGKKNVRTSWIFVKTALVLNYCGQGAWLLTQTGVPLEENKRVFYAIMPEWFLFIGIAIATMAAIIASQALISGSFTLVSEAIRLHLYPKVKVKFPTKFKGQIYIPSLNTLLLAGCIGVVLFFKESSEMEHAYGLAITLCMLMTTILMAYYLKIKRVGGFWIGLFLVSYLVVEGAFLLANLIKFMHGGYVTLIIASVIIAVMYIWLKASQIKNRLIEFVKIGDYKEKLIALSKDTMMPKFSTHLIFLSKARMDDEVEQNVLYSILQKRPKRADVYWFVNVDVTDEPYTMEYKVNVIAPDDIIRVRFRLGFRVQQRISYYLRLVIEDMVKNDEINLDPHYHTFFEDRYIGDFRFVIIEEELSYENELPVFDQFIMNAYMTIKGVSGSPVKWFGLDTSVTTVEKVPIIIRPKGKVNLKRMSLPN